MRPTARILLVAVVAGGLGLTASLLTTGPGPLLRSELGQRALGALLAARAPEPAAGTVVAKPGEPLPAMTLPDLRGQPVSLPTAYAGRPLLINLWASWCGPCASEMPELQRFSRQQAANGVQVVGIALDDPAAVKAFVKRLGVSYPVLLDAPGPADAGVRLGNPAGVLPYTVLVSPQGILLKQRIGPFGPGEVATWAAP
ncbi:TlpA family protein disulfide reductase [Cognatiluteimonas profundi]|uniref:TlpA family protein disulfide reductase n=1 Tax=Cognatiluteimonas profundi TaxID=2594501 RepID=UPI00131BB21E|nr:TlpA disulfide reductase family protein [Lysobacter profundi]